ncbi:MAG: DUF3099 domain-containing protein [Nocardioides sp.]
MARKTRHPEAPVRITTAAPSRGDDIAARQRRYLIAMGIRTLCFLGAIIAHGWLRWSLVGAALVLPYVAVVMANAASSKSEDFALREGPNGRRELPNNTDSKPL